MRAKLVTNCGCTKFLEIENQSPEIKVPMKMAMPANMAPGEGWSSTYKVRTFSIEQSGHDELGEFLIYRENL